MGTSLLHVAPVGTLCNCRVLVLLGLCGAWSGTFKVLRLTLRALCDGRLGSFRVPNVVWPCC